MKKLLLFLSFFAFSLSFSQTYTPLLKEGNKWWESLSEGYCDGCNAFSDGFYYFINGEEVINNITYKKIYVNHYYFWKDVYTSITPPPLNVDVFSFICVKIFLLKKFIPMIL